MDGSDNDEEENVSDIFGSEASSVVTPRQFAMSHSMPTFDRIRSRLHETDYEIPETDVIQAAEEFVTPWLEADVENPGETSFSLFGFSQDSSFSVNDLDDRHRDIYLDTMALQYRFVEANLIDVTDESNEIGKRFQRVLELVATAKEIVYVTNYFRCVSNGEIILPPTTVNSFHHCPFKIEDTSDKQQLYLYLLKCAKRLRYRKLGDFIYEEICIKVIRRENGDKVRVPLDEDEMLYIEDDEDVIESVRTGAFREKSDMKRFVYDCCQKEVAFKHWQVMMDGYGVIKTCIEHLIWSNDIHELPILKMSRHIFSFTDGVFDADTNTFYDFDDLPANCAAAKFFERSFNYEQYRSIQDDPLKNWNDIETPALNAIFSAQNITGDVLDWNLAFLGRMIYTLHTHDGWEIIPYWVGAAGSGKSTLGRVVSDFFMPQLVGILSNNAEKKFGLYPLLDKWCIICYEVTSDFSMEQTELQCAASGEPITAAVKNGPAVTKKFDKPMLFMGNQFFGGSNNSGSLSRRFAITKFTETVKNSDPNLSKKLVLEMPQIIAKVNWAYRYMSKKYGSKNIWNILPQHFIDTKNDLRRATHAVVGFIIHGINNKIFVREDEGYICLSVFKKMFWRFMEKTDPTTRPKLTKDYLEGNLKEVGLELAEGQQKEINGQLKWGTWINGFRIGEDNEEDDMQI